MKRLGLMMLLSMGIGLFAMPTLALDANIQIADPWIRAAPPAVQTLAGYLTIKNQGSKKKTIAKVNSPMFAKIEVHESIMHDGMAMMKAKEGLTIPPGTQVQLAPGRLHLMLIAPQKQLQLKDLVPMTMTFVDGSSVMFDAEVRSGAVAPGREGTQEHHHH